MSSKAQSVLGSRLAVAITAVIVTTVVIAGGVAVASVANNSVTSAKIRNGAVRTVDIRNGAVTSAKIANGTVTNTDLAASTRVRSESFTAGPNLNLAGNGSNQIPATVTINAATAGQLLITASMRPDVTVTDLYGCGILVDGQFRDPTNRQVEAALGSSETGCSTNDGLDVPAGNHTVALQTSGVAVGNVIDWASLQVLFVPA